MLSGGTMTGFSDKKDKGVLLSWGTWDVPEADNDPQFTERPRFSKTSW